jgi:hypothetical protein
MKEPGDLVKDKVVSRQRSSKNHKANEYQGAWLAHLVPSGSSVALSI